MAYDFFELAADLIDGCYETLGEPATYRPSAGGSCCVTAIMEFVAVEIPGFMSAQAAQSERVVRIRKSEVAAPLVGDTITMRGADWSVTEVPPALDDLEFQLTVVA